MRSCSCITQLLMILRMTNGGNKVAKILKDFGTRIQYSVFECDTDRRALLRLQDRLQKVINLGEDTITFYHLCAACEKQIDRIGIKKGLDEQSYIV